MNHSYKVRSIYAYRVIFPSFYRLILTVHCALFVCFFLLTPLSGESLPLDSTWWPVEKFSSSTSSELLHFPLSLNPKCFSCKAEFPITYHQPDTVPKRISPLRDSVPVNPNANRRLLSNSDSRNENALSADTSGLGRNGTDTLPVDSLSPGAIPLNLKLSRDTLDAKVTYEAKDSIVIKIKKNKAYLYGKANTDYKDLNLSADYIEVDQQTQIVTATFTRDSLGARVGAPKLVQGETNFTADTVQYNFKTQKGITKTTFTQQGEMYVSGTVIKKVNATDFFANRAIITTCNFDEPHFGFRASKMKLVNKKLAVTGPVHPEFEGVPIPVYLPFGLFPLASGGRKSGILAPTFTTNQQFGLGLEGLGYYKVLSDNFDVTALTNIYSYGGWSLNVQPQYIKRYRYSGGMGLSIQNFKINFKGDPDYTETRTFNFRWNHSADAKARPGTSFSANVNFGSTRFNQFIPNNPMANFNNNLSSSISYSKNWEGKVNLNVNANHNQNANTRLVNLNLPDIGFTVNTLYPFQRKEMVGSPRWYEKLGIGLNTNIRSLISFYDSSFTVRRLLDTIQWGATNNIPITLSLPPIGPLQFAPSISYDERFYSQEFIRAWNPTDRKVDTVINKGFYAARQMAFGLSLNTALFGTAKFKSGKIQAIRHVVRPTIGASYRPDFQRRNYYNTQVDTSGRVQRFSRFDGSIAGAFSEGTFGGMNFGIDNNLEMKVRSKTDTSEEGVKKVRIIDGFGINGSYNFLADSFALSTFSLYARSTLFEKISITANAVMDPYQVDERGFRVNRLAWEGRKFSPASLGRITSGSLAVSTQFTSKPKDDAKQKEKELLEQQGQINPVTMEEQMNQLDFARNNPAQFADFNIPWSLNLSFALSFNRILSPDYSGFQTQINSNINMGGDFNLTPKWKAGANGFYDFRTNSIQSLTMFVSREMHCWQMSINITPVGLFRSFSININPKSGLLRDLRINRTRSFYNVN